MSDIRVKTRTIIYCVLFALLFCLMVISLGRPNCVVTNDVPRAFSRSDDLPVIYAITPTYDRPVQRAELTRLAQAIRLAPNIHWIIIEDSEQRTEKVKNVIKRNLLEERTTILNVKTPDDFKLKGKSPKWWSKPRGVEQRNLALSWLRKHLKGKPEVHSVVYFMDDDNTYSVELFDQMSLIQPGRVGVWPVGLVGGLLLERPLLNENNVVVGYNSVWEPKRPFPCDMAGFAISTDLLLTHSNANFSYDVKRGYQESEILRQVTVLADLQPLANNCKDVLVWHTRTEKPNLDQEVKLRETSDPENKV